MSLARTLLACSALSLSFSATADPFVLTSPTVIAGERLPPEHVITGFGCAGRNLSPALEWRNPPAGTKSFAVTMFDPDAPTGSGWWHWVVLNIPAETTGLAQAAGDADGRARLLPYGALQTRTDFGAPGFGGACPPVGDKPHRYIFAVHALGTAKIELPPDASAAMASYLIRTNEIGRAVLTALHDR
jgi:Raf kinase inhibitor-like YbhB/YbcL family protein